MLITSVVALRRLCKYFTTCYVASYDSQPPPPPPLASCTACSRPNQRVGRGFIYILLWQTMLIVTNAFDLVFNLFMFLVVLKGRAIVYVPRLVLRNQLIHISSALCCYTCNTCVWSTQINLEPLISIIYFSRPEPASLGVGSKCSLPWNALWLIIFSYSEDALIWWSEMAPFSMPRASSHSVLAVKQISKILISRAN